MKTIKVIGDYKFPGNSHILFDSDVVIDIIQSNLLSEIKIFLKNSKVIPCLTSPINIELLNTINKEQSLALQTLASNFFWPIPITNNHIETTMDIVRYTTIISKMNKRPSVNDLLLASSLLHLRNSKTFILTGNLCDFHPELLACTRMIEAVSGFLRKPWYLLEPIVDPSELKRTFENINQKTKLNLKHS